MRSITALPGGRFAGLYPLSWALIGAGILFFVIVAVVRNIKTVPPANNISGALDALPTIAPIVIVSDPLPTMAPVMIEDSNGVRMPVYFLGPEYPTSTPEPTMTPWPTVVMPTIVPTWAPKYAIVGQYENKRVVTPYGSIPCNRFGIDMYGNAVYFGDDNVAGWFHSVDGMEVINACRGAS